MQKIWPFFTERAPQIVAKLQAYLIFMSTRKINNNSVKLMMFRKTES